MAYNWEEEESVALLGLVADLYVTISFCQFMHGTLQARTEETTQKPKGICKCV